MAIFGRRIGSYAKYAKLRNFGLLNSVSSVYLQRSVCGCRHVTPGRERDINTYVVSTDMLSRTSSEHFKCSDALRTFCSLSETHRTRQMSSVAAVLVNKSPSAIQPYMKLMRIDRPIGSWLLFWPCGWSIAMATPAGSLPDIYLLTLFGLGAFIMRGAGCTINDMWDKDIDGKVARTKDRPLVVGAVTQFESWVFLAGQLGLGLLILLQLNWYSVLLGASSMGLVVAYPLMKRITNWPQLVLGMAFNWGALLGWSAVHGSCNWNVCLPLYLAGVSWTLIYDTIYAHQDKIDDVVLGIKSTALMFGDKTRLWLSGFSTTMVTGLLTAGLACEQTWPYYVAVTLITGHLGWQVSTLDINSPSDCSKKFMSNRRLGSILFFGILAGILLKSNKREDVSPGLKHVDTRKEVTYL